MRSSGTSAERNAVGYLVRPSADGWCCCDGPMKYKVYIETTIPSYLTAWPSRDLVKAAQQQATREWWRTRDRFDLLASQLVIEESSAGDPQAAKERLEALAGIPVLRISKAATALAGRLVERVPLPDKAAADALHIAIAVVGGVNYLLTWNCRHIANAAMRHRIETVCRTEGYEPPVICTPVELMED